MSAVRRLIGAAAVLAVLTACGEDTGEPIDTDGDDLSVIHKDVEGRSYLCLYVYRDGGYDGGPALWCDRIDGES